MQQPQGASIWGSINTCVEIALNVYYIYAEHGEGIVFSKEKASQVLSAKAIEAGTEDGESLYYGKDDTMDGSVCRNTSENARRRWKGRRLIKFGMASTF